MNKGVKRIASLFLAVVMLFSTMVVTTSAATVANVGALLDSYAAGSGTFTVTTSSRIYVVGASAPTGDLLQTAQLIQREMRAEFEKKNEGKTYFENMVWGPAEWALTGDVVLVLDADSGTGADGYKLDVTGTTATVTAADVDGLIYGVNTLMKCFRAVGGNSVSGFSAYDTPDTKERTVHLDLARKYYTAEWVKNFIKQMSWMGYNALELHLSEDGGFRADFWDSNYYTDDYRPDNNFTWLSGSKLQYWVYSPYNKDPDEGKYLTTAELVDICNVAKEYHIEIIPSFDTPAHMDYINWKFEQHYNSNTSYSFKYNGTTYKASDTSGCINYKGVTGKASPNGSYAVMELDDDIKRGKMARAFAFALYEDIADFFKEYAGSTNFMIGADEVTLSSSTWEYSDFVSYVTQLNSMLNDKGYTVRMYNDFIGSTTYNQSNSMAMYDFPDNIEICYWNSDFQPTSGGFTENIWHVAFFWHDGTDHSEVVSSWPSSGWGDGGRTLYNAAQTNTYYVLRYAHGQNHADARDPDNRQWTFYGTNEEDIYNKWYPANIAEQGVYSESPADVPEEHLGGAYFLIWNDYAALNTEYDVWNGAVDTWDGHCTYYLFDIMASNIMKMWNADINSSVTYSKFAEVREATLEWFPGFTSCSKAASLPAATTIEKASAPAPDHSALQQKIAEAESITNTNGTYTQASFAALSQAIASAKSVDEDEDATADELAEAVTSLQKAIDALVDRSELEAKLREANGISNADGKYTTDSFDALQTAIDTAQTVYDNDESTEAQISEAVNSLVNAIGGLEENETETPDTPVTPDIPDIDDTDPNTPTLSTSFTKAYLKTLIRNAFPTDTDAPFGATVGWDNYKTAVGNANAALSDNQDAINSAVINLLKAENALATPDENTTEADDPAIISVSKISSAANGSYVTLKIVTNSTASYFSASVNGENCENEEIIAQGKLQKLKNGSIVKVWLVKIPVTFKGEYGIKYDGTTLVINP
ncbi:MAG: family 20 glycosylhydrolase [Clostridia bacterium]|nr:family 20 glycosylhydrolase [Clostridia bacterium]